MKHLKLILMIFVLASVLTLSIVASAETTVSIAPVEIEQGTATVDVTVSVASDEGILGMGYLEVYVPTGWTYVADSLVYHEEVLDDIKGIALDATFDAKLNSVSVLWDSQDAETPSENNTGKFFTVTLNVPADAEGEYEITVEVTEMYVTEDWDEVYPEATGIVTVKAAAPAATITPVAKNLLLDSEVAAKVYFDYTGTETLMIDGKPAAHDDKGYYAVITVAPKNYKNEFTFTATADDVADAVTYTTSIAATLEEYGNDDLAVALATYCEQADIYFNGGDAKPVEANVVVNTTPYINTKDEINGVKFNSTSLILEEKVTIRHYFTYTGAAPAGFTIDTNPENEGFVYVEETVDANELQNQVTTVVGEFEIKFAALDYVNVIVEKNEDEKLVNLVKALYLYNVAAVAYAG